MRRLFNVDNPFLDIILLIVVGICIVWAVILMTVNDKANANIINIEALDSKYDSILYYLKTDYSLLKKADSLNNIKNVKAFYISRDSVNIDSRGYFYSKYHRKYKIKQ